MSLSDEKARQLLACYRSGTADESVPVGRVEDHFTADELRLADMFKFTFHTAAMAKADGRPLERDALEQMVARIYNVRCADVRTALELFTEQVPLEDWVSAACDKHNLYQLIPALEASSKQVTA